MPADKRLIECPSCYATKGQYHKPGCPALTPPADPAAVQPPEWAVEMANTVGDCGSHHDSDGACCVEIVNRIARLLASVREGAIEECKRSAAEFAEYCDATAGEFGARGDWANAESWLRYGRGAFMFRTARLDALLDTPPSGGGGA